MRHLYTVGYEGYEGYVAGYGRVRWGTAMGLLQFDAVAAARCCASRLASRTAIMKSRLFSKQNAAFAASPSSSARFQACQQVFL